ncbi:glutamine ABC transporter permease, partial [Mycobacterium tuberculosis]|nr:glutamine ABC transporter permease [Mycobacterium tuberculosis]
MRAESASGEGIAGAIRSPQRLIAAAVALLIGLFGAAMLTPARAAADGETYVVATDITFAPFEFQDVDGKFV